MIIAEREETHRCTSALRPMKLALPTPVIGGRGRFGAKSDSTSLLGSPICTLDTGVDCRSCQLCQEVPVACAHAQMSRSSLRKERQRVKA
jgi:hypothetical protein